MQQKMPIRRREKSIAPPIATAKVFTRVVKKLAAMDDLVNGRC